MVWKGGINSRIGSGSASIRECKYATTRGPSRHVDLVEARQASMAQGYRDFSLSILAHARCSPY